MAAVPMTLGLSHGKWSGGLKRVMSTLEMYLKITRLHYIQLTSIFPHISHFVKRPQLFFFSKIITIINRMGDKVETGIILLIKMFFFTQRQIYG